MPNSTCAVKDCRNKNRQLTQWAKEFCTEHNCQRKNGLCDCSPPFQLFKFPTEKKDPETRAIWTKLVKRRNSDGTPWVPNEGTRICSKHFVDGHPTPEHPYPTLKLGYDTRFVKIPKPRKPPKQRAQDLHKPDPMLSKNYSRINMSFIKVYKGAATVTKHHQGVTMATKKMTPTHQLTRAATTNACGFNKSTVDKNQDCVYHTQNTQVQSLLSEMQRRREFCDATFLLPEGVLLLAHKVVVCAYSPVIHKICSNDKIQQINIKIDLREAKVDSHAVQTALDFMYGRKIEFSEQDADGLKKIATLLKITMLEQYVTEAMKVIPTDTEASTAVYIKQEPVDSEAPDQTAVKVEPEDDFEKLVTELENQQYMNSVENSAEANDTIDAYDSEKPSSTSNVPEVGPSLGQNFGLNSQVQTASEQSSLSTTTLSKPLSATKRTLDDTSCEQTPQFLTGKRIKIDLNIFDQRSRNKIQVQSPVYVEEKSKEDTKKLIKVVPCFKDHHARQRKIYKCIIADCRWNYRSENCAQLQLHNLAYHAEIKDDRREGELRHKQTEKFFDGDIQNESERVVKAGHAQGNSLQESEELHERQEEIKNLKQVGAKAVQNTESTEKFCHKCGKDFEKNKFGIYHFDGETLKNHKCENKLVVIGKKIRCLNCRWSFPDVVSMQLHARKIHPGQGTYNCTFCDTVCDNWLNLIAHWNQHTSVICQICSKECGNYSKLMNHRYKKHSIERKILPGVQCDLCGKVYKYRSGYKHHYDKIHAEQKFKCDFCPRTFGSEFIRKNHMNVLHIKKIVCHICGKLFSTLKRLKSHQISHSTEKRYKCDICGNRFKFQSGVYMHLKTVHKLGNAVK